VRYTPGSYRVLSAAYRRQQGQSRQVDIGWQWPLSDLWGDRGRDLGPGLGEGEGGRWYSVEPDELQPQGKPLVDGILGLEYDGGCWIGRIVLERMQAAPTPTSASCSAGVRGLQPPGGQCPAEPQAEYPRYQFRERASTPSRFSNYD
jgi:LPS-assembly protein